MSREKMMTIIATKAKFGSGSLESSMDLKKDLGMDSVALIELSVEVYNQFDIDLGEKFEEGNPLATVGDLLKALDE